MSDGVLTTIEATIMTKTKEALLNHCDVTGLSIGEVIDRVVLGFAVEEPEVAASILCEEFLIMTSNQTDEQIKETIKLIASTLISSVVMCGVNKDYFFNEISECIRERYLETQNL